MKQPFLDVISTSRDMIETFGGYNHNIRISDGEFFDMKNLTATYYPVLSPRAKRGVYEYPRGTSEHSPQALICKDALCYVDGRYFVINNYRIDMNLSTDAAMCPKQLVSMGSYVIIMPDKKYINTIANGDGSYDSGNIEANYTSSSPVTFSICKSDGSAYSNYNTGATEPSNPQAGELWIDTSTTPHTLKQYSAVNSMWVQVATTYVKIASPDIATNLKAFDGVKISGIDSSLTQLQDINGQVSVLWEAHHTEDGAGDYIVIVGIIDEIFTQASALTVSRYMPNLDFVIESNNRLWGCRYGTDINGNIVNEIYASKAADFKNWNCFMGLSTDSYTASCGTDGQWTGAVNHLGYPIFFKENCMHKVYGNYPSNYQIQSTACRGVQKGCGNSLAILNERLFYKSNNGVCVYDGSLPSEISSAFGNIHYSDVDETMSGEWSALRSGAAAGAFNNRYYISMRSEEDRKWYLFVFDTSTGMWHKEDETRVTDFCACNGELYFINHEDNTIKTVFGSGAEVEEQIVWMAESGVMGMSLPDKKYVSKLLIRTSLTLNACINVFIQYNSCGEWEKIYTAAGVRLTSFDIPIKPKRCDTFKLRIEGVGDAKIYSIVKTLEQGSEL